MKNTLKILRQFMALMLIALTLTSMFTSTAFAASSTTKCYTISSGNTQVYSDTGLSKKYGTIYGSDEVTVLSVSSKYCKVTYPISGGGTKTGYISTSAILRDTSGSTYTSKAKVTTYTRPSGQSYGYIAVGDKVVKLGTKNDYVQVKYPVSGGYKYAWVTADGWNKIQGSSSNSNTTSGTTSSSWDEKIGETVASIKNGSSYTKYYNSDGNISAAGGYIGQCTWYAYGRFYEVTGIQLKTARHAKYWLSENDDDKRVKVLEGASEIVSKSIAVRTSGTYGHVMFIEHVTYTNGKPSYVYFTECNADGDGKYTSGKDAILQRMTYEDFVSKKNPAGYIVKA